MWRLPIQLALAPTRQITLEHHFHCVFDAVSLLSLHFFCCLISGRLKDRALASMGEKDDGRRDHGKARDVEVEGGRGEKQLWSLASSRYLSSAKAASESGENRGMGKARSRGRGRAREREEGESAGGVRERERDREV